MRKARAILIALLTSVGASPLASADAPSIPYHSALNPVPAIRAVLALLDDQIDFATAELTFNKLADPSIDVNLWPHKIATMERAVEALAGPDASEWDKIGAVRKYIYEIGPWNGYQPYAYDLKDPDGRVLTDKLLPTYITTRRGNCISMPFLFLILADHMGVPITASEAPDHVFLKVTDQATGEVINLEPTSGAHPERDAWLRQQDPMTDQAIANGVYLRALTKKETVAVMASILIEFYYTEGRYDDVIQIADAVLEYHPKLVAAMVFKGDSYEHLIDQDFVKFYRRPIDIPPDLLPLYQLYVQQTQASFNEATVLGWRPDE